MKRIYFVSADKLTKQMGTQMTPFSVPVVKAPVTRITGAIFITYKSITWSTNCLFLIVMFQYLYLRIPATLLCSDRNVLFVPRNGLHELNTAGNFAAAFLKLFTDFTLA